MNAPSLCAPAVGLEEKVAFLRSPRSYPARPSRVEPQETHMSYVFLTDTDAFKLNMVALTREHDGRLALDGDGPVVDWLVRMRRLPRERMLDRLIVEQRLAAH